MNFYEISYKYPHFRNNVTAWATSFHSFEKVAPNHPQLTAY